MKFFKSTWFKCIAVLLSIAVVLGGLLAILNDLLYVSPEERTGRVFQKVYGRVFTADEYTVKLDVDSKDPKVEKKAKEYKDSENNTFGYIEKIYEVGKDDTDMTIDTKYDLLFKSTGCQGYKGGTVTLWIKVAIDGDQKEIQTVLIDSYEKQTLMSQLGSKYLGGFMMLDISDNYSTYFSANAAAKRQIRARIRYWFIRFIGFILSADHGRVRFIRFPCKEPVFPPKQPS